MPLGHRFPVFGLFTIKLFFPFYRGHCALGAVMALLVAPRAAVGLDIVEELALSIIGDAAPFESRGRIRSFQTRWEGGLFFVGGAEITGGILAGLEFVFPVAMVFLP